MPTKEKETSRSERTKLRLGNKILDIAEVLPKFNRGTIASLQRIRQHQRERGRKVFEGTQGAQGSELSLSQMILLEVFPIEEFDGMVSGLQRLFPERRFSLDPIADIEEGGTKLFSGSWHSLGMITRKQQNPLFSPYPLHTAAALPNDVKNIEIEVQKIFPSLFVLSFHLELEPSATDKLKSLQEDLYLPRIRFRQWFPKSLRFIGPYSEEDPESVKAGAISEWMLSLRKDTERVLRNYFSGFFFRATPKDRVALPAVNLFELRGEYSTKDEDQWLAGLAPRLKSMSLTQAAYKIDLYCDEDVRVFTPWEAAKTMYQILRVQPLDASRNDDHEHFRMEEIVRALTAAGGAFEFLSRIQTTIEELRFRVYQRLMSTRFINRFSKNLLLYQEVQRARLLLTRFSFEYDQQEHWFSGELESLSRFYYVGEWRHTALSKNICDELAFKTRHIQSHLDLVNSSFLDNISARNTRLMYRLQLQVLIWTVFVALATAVGVIGPNVVRNWLQVLWIRFH